MKHVLIRILALAAALIMLFSTALAYNKLKRGDKNSDVLAMQQALNRLGYSLKEDGSFGSGTLDAVKDFQKKHNLTVDGVAGNQTLTLLYQLADGAQTTSVPATAASSTATPAPQSGVITYATLRQGSSGMQVLAMQQALQKLGYSLTADGKYGAGTQTTVKTFQKDHDLKDDGVAGNQTLTLLYQLASGAQSTTAPATTVPATTAPATATPTPQPGVITYATLRKGNSGLQVLAMQQALQKLGYSLAADGKYGAGTQTTVKTFQKDHGLKDDGVAGNETLTLLYRLATGAASTTPPVPSAPATAAPGGITATVETGSGTLNLRAEPKSGADVLRTIPNHTVLSVTSRGTTWCGVIYNGQSGYVMTSFLRFDEDVVPTETPTASPAPVVPAGEQTAVVTTTGGTLNFRAGASSSAKIISQIPNAVALTVTERGSEWCAVVYDGRSGFVMTKFLSFLTPESDAAEETSQPTASPVPVDRTLKSGMTGDDVAWVQTRLKELGYTVTVNGTYDSATAAAVKSFQTHNCLSSDGIAGSQTMTMLRSDSARKATDAIPSYTTLRVDDTGSNVTNMQNALKGLGYPVTVNGSYDVDTHNAVVAFQQRNGLVISGIADGITQTLIYGGGKPYSTAVSSVDLSEHRMAAPSASSMKLLKWYDEVKPSIKTGQTALILDPNTGLSWHIKFYSLGHHADSEPLTWEDTQVMNASFGKTSWTVHPVYVQLPSGQWTMATMHNRPHLYGSIMNNGFGGHLCIHFLRDVSECIRVGDDDYGVQNQRTLRSAWKALTGEIIPEN